MDSGFEGFAWRPVKRLAINSAATQLDLVAADPRASIRLTQLALIASGAGTVVFFSGDDEIGRITFKAADPTLVLPRSPDGWLQTVQGEKLHLTNTGALTLTGFGNYILK